MLLFLCKTVAYLKSNNHGEAADGYMMLIRTICTDVHQKLVRNWMFLWGLPASSEAALKAALYQFMFETT